MDQGFVLDSALFVHKRGMVLLLAGSGGLKGVRGLCSAVKR